MNANIKNMNYEEFCEYCEERWSMEDAIKCIRIIDDINSHKASFLGVTRRKKTKKLRNDIWDKIKYQYF